MFAIYKTITIPLKCSKDDFDALVEYNKLSANVWNLCLKLNKESVENNNRNITKGELQKLTKKCVDLHAKGIQHIVHKYIYARDSAFKAIEGEGINVKLPYKIKSYMTAGWDSQSIKTDKEKCLIYLARSNGCVNGKKRRRRFTCFAKNVPENIVQIELIHKDKYYLAVKCKESVEYLQIKSNNHASIDLGEIHSITSIDSSGNAIIITGRRIRSIKQLRNKHQAKIYSRMSKCKKDSKQYKKYLNALNNLKHKTDRKINDAVHKVTKLYLDFCIENNISIVYYGDLDSVIRNTKKRRKGNKLIRQKLTQWNFGQIMKQLENKLNRYGIKLIKVKEYYTSQKCPKCKSLNKPKGRNYKCECGYTQHRDIVGAINILNDNFDSKITKYINKKYLRIE